MKSNLKRSAKTTGFVILFCILFSIIFNIQISIFGDNFSDIITMNPLISGFLHINLSHFGGNILVLFLFFIVFLLFHSSNSLMINYLNRKFCCRVFKKPQNQKTNNIIPKSSKYLENVKIMVTTEGTFLKEDIINFECCLKKIYTNHKCEHIKL